MVVNACNLASNIVKSDVDVHSIASDSLHRTIDIRKASRQIHAHHLQRLYCRKLVNLLLA